MLIEFCVQRPAIFCTAVANNNQQRQKHQYCIYHGHHQQQRNDPMNWSKYAKDIQQTCRSAPFQQPSSVQQWLDSPYWLGYAKQFQPVQCCPEWSEWTNRLHRQQRADSYGSTLGEENDRQQAQLSVIYTIKLL